MAKKRIAVFISGRGSNFKAILENVKNGKINGEIVVVISDNPDARGLNYARQENIQIGVFQRSKNKKRNNYFKKIIDFLSNLDIDLIVLAGFMRVLSKNIIEKYKNRIVNIHPALLPSFPGIEAQKQAVDYGVKYSGCTVHFVDDHVDNGPIILQEVEAILNSDTEETLASRILKKEHIIYPKAVKLFCEDRLLIKGRRVFIKE